MDWGLVPTLLAVVEEGSLSGAGRKLGLSQPTVGRHVSDLETQMGLTLFTRAARGLVPTEAALQLAERARPMQQAAADMNMFASGRSSDVTGTVRLTASEVVATYVLPAIIRDLLADEPGLEIEVVASNSTENLLLREADIAVRMTEPTQPELIARKVGELDIGLFAHERYLDRAGPLETPADLSNHVFVGYDRSDLMIKGMQAMGMEVTRNDFRYRTDNQISHVEAICAGVGIGAGQVSTLAHRDGVKHLLPELPIPGLPMWLAAHRELRTSMRVRRVYDFLGDRLKDYVNAQSNVRSITQ